MKLSAVDSNGTSLAVSISVDGKPAGTTPETINLSVGTHTIVCGPAQNRATVTGTVEAVIQAAGGSVNATCTYGPLQPGVTISAVDGSGNLLTPQILVNGLANGEAPQTLHLSAGSTISCQPLTGYTIVQAGPYTVTSAAAQSFNCLYTVNSVGAPGGQVALIVNTFEPGYGPYQFASVQITDSSGQILITSGTTNQMGTVTLYVPQSTNLIVDWGSPSSPVTSLFVNSGTTTQTVTLEGNPAQTQLSFLGATNQTTGIGEIFAGLILLVGGFYTAKTKGRGAGE